MSGVWGGATGAAGVDAGEGVSFACVSAGDIGQRCSWGCGAQRVGSGDHRTLGCASHWGLGAGVYRSADHCLGEADAVRELAVGEEFGY